MHPKLFFLVSVFLLARIGTNQAVGQCHTVERSIGGMFLKGSTFKTCEVRLPEECYFKCEEEITCQSYNFVIGRNVCELNNRTKEARPGNFMADRNRFYMKRVKNRVPLGSTEKLPAESCTEITDSEGSQMVKGEYWIYSTEHGQTIQARCEENWQKINTEPVCFGAKNNKYGAFNMTKSGRLKTMKLIHRSGVIRCNPITAASYWGCTHSKYGKTLMTIITNTRKEPVLPPGEDLEAFQAGDSTPNCITIKHFYTVKGTNHTSPELVFRDLSSPLSVSRNQELQIWYGQDWKDCAETDNKGYVCVDVYAWYM